VCLTSSPLSLFLSLSLSLAFHSRPRDSGLSALPSSHPIYISGRYSVKVHLVRGVPVSPPAEENRSRGRLPTTFRHSLPIQFLDFAPAKWPSSFSFPPLFFSLHYLSNFLFSQYTERERERERKSRNVFGESNTRYFDTRHRSYYLLVADGIRVVAILLTVARVEERDWARIQRDANFPAYVTAKLKKRVMRGKDRWYKTI